MRSPRLDLDPLILAPLLAVLLSPLLPAPAPLP